MRVLQLIMRDLCLVIQSLAVLHNPAPSFVLFQDKQWTVILAARWFNQLSFEPFNYLSFHFLGMCITNFALLHKNWFCRLEVHLMYLWLYSFLIQYSLSNGQLILFQQVVVLLLLVVRTLMMKIASDELLLLSCKRFHCVDFDVHSLQIYRVDFLSLASIHNSMTATISSAAMSTLCGEQLVRGR